MKCFTTDLMKPILLAIYSAITANVAEYLNPSFNSI
jgi:hypothetical protein